MRLSLIRAFLIIIGSVFLAGYIFYHSLFMGITEPDDLYGTKNIIWALISVVTCFFFGVVWFLLEYKRSKTQDSAEQPKDKDHPSKPDKEPDNTPPNAKGEE